MPESVWQLPEPLPERAWNITDFEQTLLLFFTHLDEQKKIRHVIIKDKNGNDVTPNAPKKRKYKLNTVKVSI